MPKKTTTSEQYKEEMWTEKKVIKSDLKKANKLKKPVNH